MSNGNAQEPVTDVFGSNVFSEAVMRERLPKDVYKSIKRGNYRRYFNELQL